MNSPGVRPRSVHRLRQHPDHVLPGVTFCLVICYNDIVARVKVKPLIDFPEVRIPGDALYQVKSGDVLVTLAWFALKGRMTGRMT